MKRLGMHLVVASLISKFEYKFQEPLSTLLFYGAQPLLRVAYSAFDVLVCLEALGQPD